MNPPNERLIALNLISAAREHGFLNEPLVILPETEEMEQNLLSLILHEILRRPEPTISGDEISSLFTYVFAKAAEMVACHTNNLVFTPGKEGMFDGKSPINSEGVIIGAFKQLTLPGELATAYCDYCREHENEADPIATLLIALKYVTRIAAHIGYRTLEKA